MASTNRNRSSIASHHIDWLRLVERSGPFLSLPVLQKVFPQGLDADDRPARSELRVAYEEWKEDSEEEEKLHTRWIEYVLGTLLEYPSDVLLQIDEESPAFAASIPEHHETLVPSWAVVDADTGKVPRILIQVVPASQSLDKPLPDRVWKASPATRMAELIRGSGHKSPRLGLVTNGEQWMLVDAARGQTTAFCTWYASLFFEEPITLRAFRSLLSARRTFRAPDETLEGLLKASAENQQDVTEQLGLQVRLAVEILVHAIDRVDRDRGRELLRGFDEQRLYEAACTVMMRLVFLLYAEERGLLPLDQAFYQEHYAVTPILDQLLGSVDRHGPEVLEYRQSAWGRLLASFRAVHGGVEHEAMRLIAYGGALFDPDRFPFLEGRPRGSSWKTTPAQPLPIDDRTVLHLLEALQVIEVQGLGKSEVESRRLSFREIDVEEIGHVYESLLDHTAMRADGPVLGLIGKKGYEPEVELFELEALEEDGEDTVFAYLASETGKNKKTVVKKLEFEIATEDSSWLVSCSNDAELVERVSPYAGLVRSDRYGKPLIINTGSVYVTQGSDRRETGTHYTPRSLTEPIVQHTLEPLVYEGPAEGALKENWKLRSAREILDLKVCDMAMGSGAFLVQACRYLSERLAETWENTEKSSGGKVVVAPFGDVATGSPSERPLPRDSEERLAIARRLIVDRCLYGVDKNPMAVEMAKLSLWLVTLHKNRPFTFVNHSLRCGDSLLGLTDLAQVENFHMDPVRGKELHSTFFDATEVCRDAVKKAGNLRRKLESISVETVDDAAEKYRLHLEAEVALDDARLLADLVIATALDTASDDGRALDGHLEELAVRVSSAFQGGGPSDEERAAFEKEVHELLDGGRGDEQPERGAFHWALEYPEVFGGDTLGFSALIGNPPFQGGQRITGALGKDYRDYLVHHIACGQRGSADLFAYFFLRGSRLLRPAGLLGMIAKKTISEGDTREVGLDQIVANGCSILRAVASLKWPSGANVEVALVWLLSGVWRGQHLLGNRQVPGISTHLMKPGAVSGLPQCLAANQRASFIGSYVLGKGFVLSEEEAAKLISKNSHNRDVLSPYLSGKDLNSSLTQSPTRWVINFHAWPLNRKSAPRGYDGPVAAEYPDCLGIVRRLVKPDRDKNKRKARRERWWQYAETCPALYRTIAEMDRVLVCSLVTKYPVFAFVPRDCVFMHKLAVHAFQDDWVFGLLSSSMVRAWIWKYSSTMRNDLNYSPSDSFQTLAFPKRTESLHSSAVEFELARQELMTVSSQGLTKSQNTFHDPTKNSAEVLRLREAQRLLDIAVMNSYGWSDVELNHDFQDTRLGSRFTISGEAQHEVLDRLLELNHQRHAQEVEEGLHG